MLPAGVVEQRASFDDGVGPKLTLDSTSATRPSYFLRYSPAIGPLDRGPTSCPELIISKLGLNGLLKSEL